MSAEFKVTKYRYRKETFYLCEEGGVTKDNVPKIIFTREDCRNDITVEIVPGVFGEARFGIKDLHRALVHLISEFESIIEEVEIENIKMGVVDE
jgi:hypothetical protein